MFGLWEDEPDEVTQEFDYAAQEMISAAPDVDTGLAAMRDIYSEYQFEDPKKAQELLESRSTELRQKFDVHTKYDFDETIEYAPIGLSTIQLEEEYEDETDRNLALIDKWELDNKADLEKSDAPINIQNRSRYVRDVEKAATAMRREMYGAENYIVDGETLKYSPSWGSVIGDTALSFGQGSVGGVASLIGADSVNDWFEEGIDPGYQENHPYVSAVASGAGTAVTAIGVGVATGGLGAGAYLGASGAGAVREQVEGAYETGATTGEALTAGAIEGVSQAAQTAVGGKIFGKVAGQIAGRAGITTLGAKVFPKIAGSTVGGIGLAAGAEALTEGAGSVASNVAQDIGQGTETPLLEGVGVSMVAGAVVGGVATGVGKGVAAAKGTKEVTVEPTVISPGMSTPGVGDSGLSQASTEFLEAGPTSLVDTIEENEGGPPPPREGVRIQTKPVTVTGATNVITNEDGSEVVTKNGQLYIKKGDTTVEAHPNNFYVSAETKASLDKMSHTPDGADVQLTTRNGKLYAETVQPYLDGENIAIDPKGKSSNVIEIPTTEATNGSFHIGATPVDGEGGTRKYKYDAAPSPVKEVSTAGAAHVSEFRAKESQYIRKLRGKYKDNPDMLEMLDLGQVDRSTGEFTELPFPQYMQTKKGQANKEGFANAEERVETEGVINVLAELDSRDRFNSDDSYLATTLHSKLTSDFNEAVETNNYKAQEAIKPLIRESLGNLDKVKTEQGRGMQVSSVQSARDKVNEITSGLQKAAHDEIGKELKKPGVTVPDLFKQSQAAVQKVKDLEKEYAVDPIDNELADIQSDENLKDEKAKAEIRTRIDEQKKIVKQRKEGEQKARDTAKEKAQKEREDAKKARDDKRATLQTKLGELRQAKREADKALKDYAGKPPASLVKTANDLAKSIDNSVAALKNKEPIQTERTEDLKRKDEVQKERKAAAKAQQLIRKLQKAEKAKTIPPPNKRKEQLLLAKEKGIEGVVLSKEKKTAYEQAKTDAKRLQEQHVKAEKKLNDKLATFPPEMRDRLRSLYEAQENAGFEGGLAIQDEILKITSSLVPPTKSGVDAIATYWRRNVLSGVETAVRNTTTVLNAASTGASYALGDIARVAKSPFTGKAPVLASYQYAIALQQGLREAGIPEALEVLIGNRGGRLQLADKPGERQKAIPLQTLRSIKEIFDSDTTPGKKFAKAASIATLWAPLRDATIVMERVLSATDTGLNRTFQEGQARVAAALLESNGEKVTSQSIDEILHVDKASKVKAEETASRNADTLRSLGVNITPRQERLMAREIIETARSKTIRANMEQHGLDNTFMGVPNNTAMGLTAKGVSVLVDGFKIPYTNFHPGKILLPFIPTASKIIDMYLAHTPLGAMRYAGMKYQQGKLQSRNKEGAAKALESGKEFTPEVDTLELQSQEQLGRVLLGTMAIGSLAVLLASQDDDEDGSPPWIKFYGMPSLEERKTWKEMGISPFTLQIGGALINKEALGPMAMAFAFADNLAKAYKNHKDGDSYAMAGANTVFLSLGITSELSFLPAVSEFMQMVQGGVQPMKTDESSANTAAAKAWNKVQSGIAATAQPLIPAAGLLKNIYKWYDGEPQETYNNLSAKFANNIPVARELVGAPSKINRFGEPIKFDLSKRLPSGVMMSKALEDPVSSWMNRTGYKFTDQPVAIKLGKAEKEKYLEYRTAEGIKDPGILDVEESRRVLEIAGPQIKAYLGTLAADSNYSVVTPENQDAINKQVSKFRAEAREMVLQGG